MPPKKKRITPMLIGPVGSSAKKGKKKLLPGKKRLKQRVKSKPKPKKRKTKTNDQIAVKLLTHMCNKLDTVCTVCKKLQSAGTTHKKKKKKAKSKGGGTVGQQTEAKLLRKQSKAYKKFGNYDANPKLAFEI